MPLTRTLMLCVASGALLVMGSRPALAQYETEPATIRTIFDAKQQFRTLTPEEANERDGEGTRYNRWEYRITPRLLKNGFLPKPSILLDELNKYNTLHSVSNNAAPQKLSGKWTPLGPFNFDIQYDGNSGGTGRVSVIRFHPRDTNTIYIGTPDGGLWKTTNAGAAWQPLTDNIPNLGISDIAIDPVHPDTIYLATGDAKDAGMYGNPYSYGILKSYDGGNSWVQSGFNLNLSEMVTIPRIVISPANTNIILAGVYGGTERGIQRSSDGGATWSQRDGGSIYDIEFNPSDPNIVYASGYGNFRRSTDAGLTWTTVTSILPSWTGNGVSRTTIGVSPADPNVVYVIYIDHVKDQVYGLYKSTDKGVSFSRVFDATTKIPPFGKFGEYNLVFTVSPVNANIIVAGEQSLAISTNGGVSWSSMNIFIHVDNHAVIFTPHSSKALYSGNDGGINFSSDAGADWSDLSSGLQITQFYRLGCAKERPDLLYAGSQDNGCIKLDGSIWSHAFTGADGGECLVDDSDENTVFMEFQFGDLFRFDIAADTNKYVAPSSNGHWITPYVSHPSNHKKIFAAYGNVFKSTDEGTTWATLSDRLVGTDNLKSLAVAASNDSVIYTGSYIKLFRTTDAGTSWSDITAGSPAADTAALTYIAVSPTDPKKIWLTFSGFTDHDHVFASTDGGATYKNITGTLPNIPVNCIVYENNSNDGVYIGTDIGVYYRDSTMSDWLLFNSGLPNVSVSELEIQYGLGVIRAATFGRGMWQSPLFDLAPPAAPILISPHNDSIGAPTIPTFVWNKAGRTGSYEIQVAEDSLFTNLVWSKTGLTDSSVICGLTLAKGSKYFWHVTGTNDAGSGQWSAVWNFKTSGTGSVNASALSYSLEHYPNPFTDKTTFQFSLETARSVSLTITDMLGRTISTTDYGILSPGTHTVTFDASNLGAGSYLYTIILGETPIRGTLILVK
ncbi:MAG TPA: T9SS type A sorting domain-containing protein [Candidatus Kapabacteria bacterium]|nr:T9SS type A sorting domain-containing protein [Candidatus Kapabacteria bacterium]